ncbi:MAG: hypothetical protein AB9917_18090 [Negativicutes bacterium]
MGNKLRVGLLIDSYQMPSWAFLMIDTIAGGDYATIALIVKKSEPVIGKSTHYLRLSEKMIVFLLSSYCKWDRFFNNLEPNAFELKDGHALMKDCPCITITLVSTESGAKKICGEDCEKVGAYNLDVLISLSCESLEGSFLPCAQYGIWSYQPGSDVNCGEAGGILEVFEARRETENILKILNREDGRDTVLCRSYAQTNKMSVCVHNNISYWKTTTFILRKLQALYVLGEQEFFAGLMRESQHPAFWSKKKFVDFKITEWIGLMLRHLLKISITLLRKIFYFNQYILLFDFNPCGEISSTLSTYKKIIPPYDRFWADPFVVYENSKYYIFIEEVIAPSNRGHISCFTIDAKGTISLPKTVIEKPYHMSYPFIFSHNNEYYMIPETSENRTIDLYKCVDFPDKWEFVTTLAENINAADATLFHKDGKWWLFACVCENPGTPSNDELFLFYSTDLFSQKWTPHVKNPIVSDVGSARPAGKIFVYNGNIYRPSQNSSKRYGYGVKMNQIVALSETEYKEECVCSIEPHWDKKIIAVHTLNGANELTIIDGLMERARRPSDLLRYLRRRWHSTSR